MPFASQAPPAQLRYWSQFKEASDLQAPPTKDVPYPVITNEVAVRLLWYRVRQTNTEENDKDITVHWILDGSDYSHTFTAQDGTWFYIYKNAATNTLTIVGTLSFTNEELNAGLSVDVRALEATITAEINSVVGTNQKLYQELIYDAQATY